MSHFARAIATLGAAALLAVALASVAPAATAFSGPPAGAGAAASVHVSGWVLQRTPQPAVPNGFIFGVSCADADWCVAVGRHIGTQGIWTTLAEAWNGTSWTVQTTPNATGSTYSELQGVSCATADACAAVGYFGLSSGKTRTLVEAWNGTSWTITTSPNPHRSATSELSGVSCVGADTCTAVGFSLSRGKTTTLAEVWNGTDWKIQTTPNATREESYLQQVSCTRASDCTAIGYSLDSSGVSQTLAIAWNGATWKLEDAPDPKGAVYVSLSGISCTSPGACTAVGSYDLSSGAQFTLVESRTGTIWKTQTSPNPGGATGSGLSAVSCTDKDACTAVGSYSDSSGTTVILAETWDGSTWNIQTTPNPAGADSSYMQGVACSEAGTCIAAGYDITSAGVVAPLAEDLVSGTWNIQAIPNPTGNITSELNGTSCSSADACAAVGSYYINTSGEVVTLAETWSGSSWKIDPTPNPAGSTLSELSSVACTGPDSCTAVGFYGAGSGLETLAEEWNGSAWSIQQTPNPPGTTGSVLSGVSCSSAHACTGVGYYVNASRDTVTLVETWNGTSWKIQASPNPAGSTTSELHEVSCPSIHSCSAVGYSLDASGIAVTLALVWNGSAWDVQTTPNPEGAARGSLLQGVSCSAAGSCISVGYDTNSSDVNATLVEAQSGTSWKIETSPNPTGAGGSELTSASCTPGGDCTAVGFYSDSSGQTVTLAESDSGSSWKIQSTPDPAGAPVSELSSVSCVQSACHAVGFHTEASGIGANLGEAAG